MYQLVHYEQDKEPPETKRKIKLSTKRREFINIYLYSQPTSSINQTKLAAVSLKCLVS